MIKETVLSHLTKKCPPHVRNSLPFSCLIFLNVKILLMGNSCSTCSQVQVIGLLCRTPQKDSRHELLRRVAAGGGVFEGENGTKVHLPGANLNEIANQADDLLEVGSLKLINLLLYFSIMVYHVHMLLAIGATVFDFPSKFFVPHQAVCSLLTYIKALVLCIISFC